MACGVFSSSSTGKLPSKLAVDTSKPVLRVYSLTSLPVIPITYILVPAVLKLSPYGLASSVATEKLSINVTVEDTSKPTESVYSFTSSPEVPITNILVPSALKRNVCGESSCPLTETLST